MRRVAVVLAVWVVAVGGALVVANALDSPVGQGARDEAQPAVPGPVASADGGLANLPPLAMVLDHSLPADIADLAPIVQAQRLRALAAKTSGPGRSVELGSVLQLLGDSAGAEAAYREALARDPGSLGAQVGLALAAGATGSDGLIAAAARMRELALANPRSQLVSFNQGWLEIYRRRGGPARDAWKRTIALGPRTRLGSISASLLATLEKGSADRNP